MASARGALFFRSLNSLNNVTLKPNFQQITKTDKLNNFLFGQQLSTCNFYHNYQTRRKSSLHKNISALKEENTTKDFIYNLQPEERDILFTEMQKFEEEQKKEAGQGSHDKPTIEQLGILAVHTSLPFIGFGFLDNCIMIMAGEQLDLTLGATFGISTMAAAALGNLISDVCGIWSASLVERLASKCGFRTPKLSSHQWNMNSTRRTSTISKGVGIAIGCFIGMFPLLFFKDKDKDKEGCDNSESKTQSKS